jgi:hypothetical protein
MVLKRMYVLKKRGAFQIVAGWWGHLPLEPAVVGVLTDHSYEGIATI